MKKRYLEHSTSTVERKPVPTAASIFARTGAVGSPDPTANASAGIAEELVTLIPLTGSMDWQVPTAPSKEFGRHAVASELS